MTLAEEPLVRLILEGTSVRVRLDRIHREWAAPCCRQGRSRRPRGHRSRHRRPPPHSGHADPLRAAVNLSPAGEPRSDLVDGDRRVAARSSVAVQPPCVSCSRWTAPVGGTPNVRRLRRGRPRGRRPSRDHRWSQSVIGQDRIGGCMFPLSMP
jgi:hypothetical protein